MAGAAARELKASAGLNPRRQRQSDQAKRRSLRELGASALTVVSIGQSQLVSIGASLLEYELFRQAYERIELWFAEVLVWSPGYGETPKPGSGKPIA